MLRFIGLDGEMSGADIESGCKLIQIGVAMPDGDLYCSLIGWNEDEMEWQERASRVHNIPKETVLAARRAEIVDEELFNWLTERGLSPDNRQLNVMVGFNVGVFDGPFVRQALPKTFSLFSRRYADLNPLCFVLGGTLAPPDGGGVRSEKGWKRYMKQQGMALVKASGREEPEHDAGTDALLALGAWVSTRDVLLSTWEAASRERKRDRDRRKQKADQE